MLDHCLITCPISNGFSFYSASASASIQEEAYIWIEERAAVHVKALTDQQSATCSTWEKVYGRERFFWAKKKKKEKKRKKT
jgi:hypothetical protein